MKDRKQMYVPLITSTGIAFDWFVPRNATIDSALWVANIVKPADAWWRNQWKQCSDEQKKTISDCIREAIEVGSKTIKENHFASIVPLDNAEVLPQSEQLCLSFRNRESPESVLSSQEPEDTDSSESTSYAPDSSHHTEIITTSQIPRIPQRASAANSLRTIQGIPSSYFSDTTDDDYTPSHSSHRSKHTQKPTKQKTHYSSSQISESMQADSDYPVCFFHFDNAPAHNSFSSRQSLQRTHLIRMPHPPYSPDLAICDFAYFGGLKTALSRSSMSVSTLSELQEVTTAYNKTLNKETMMALFRSWQRRLLYVAEHNGDYCPVQVQPTEQSTITQQQHKQHVAVTPAVISNQSSLMIAHKGIVGLTNTTSTFCYMNALLQCLIVTSPLVNYCLSHSSFFQDSDLSHLQFHTIVMQFIREAWSAYKKSNPVPYTCIQQWESLRSTRISILDPSPIAQFVESHLPPSSDKQQDVVEAFQCFWNELVCHLFNMQSLLVSALEKITVTNSRL